MRKILGLFAILLLILSLNTPTYSQNSDVEKLLEMGKKAYAEGKFDLAIQKLSQAVTLIKNKADLLDAYLALSLTYFTIGKEEKARENIVKALSINPKQTLDPEYYPPKFISLVEEVRGKFIVRVVVSTNATCKIYVDGNLIGEGQLFTLDLTKDSHNFMARAEGYKTMKKQITIKEQNQKVILNLAKLPAKKPVIKKAKEEKKPAVSEKGVKVKEGKKRHGKALYIIGGTGLALLTAAVLFRKGGILNKGTGTIKITSNPEGATVFLDGQKKGETPLTIENVSPGNHTIKAEIPLYGKWEDKINVKGYQEYNINAVLAPYKYKFDRCFGGGGKFNIPWDITIDNSGNFYVSDYLNNKILKFNREGNTLRDAGIKFPTGIKFSPPTKSIYAVQSYRGSFSELSNFSLNLTPNWKRNLGLWEPTGLGVDSAGNIYIAEADNSLVIKTDPRGNIIKKWVVIKEGSLPMDVETSKKGNVYVSACALGEVIIYSKAGVKKGEFSKFIYCPSGIAIDSFGNVYVASYSENTIYKFTGDGKYILNFGRKGSGNGQLNSPIGIAVYDNGNVLVADSKNNRICVWNLSNETMAGGTAKITIERKTGSSFKDSGTKRRFPNPMGHSIKPPRRKRIRK